MFVDFNEYTCNYKCVKFNPVASNTNGYSQCSRALLYSYNVLGISHL